MAFRGTTDGSRPSDIDSLRGLACLLLVFFHALGGTTAEGLQVDDGSWHRLVFAELPSLVRMPLFTFLSGYVYAMRPVSSTAVASFVRGKARRLLIPFAVVMPIFVLTQGLVGGGQSNGFHLSEIWRAFVWPYAHFWYLPALFWVFMTIGALELSGLLSTWKRWTAVWLLSTTALLVFVPTTQLLGLGGGAYLLKFFLWGLGVRRFVRAPLPAWIASAVLATASSLLAFQLIAHSVGWDSALVQQSPVAFIAGVFSAFALLLARLRARPLARLGAYSYTVFLFHVFGTASAGTVLRQLTDSVSLQLACTVAAGIALPVVVHKVAIRHPMSRMLLLGLSIGPPGGHPKTQRGGERRCSPPHSRPTDSMVDQLV